MDTTPTLENEQPINLAAVAAMLQHMTMMLCMMNDRFEMLEARIGALESQRH